MTDKREEALTRWLSEKLGQDDIQLKSISGDASFRRYFRLMANDCQLIAVDAPPTYVNNQGFIDIAALLARHKLRVPQVTHHDLANGFMLLSDLGNTLYLDQLSKDTADDLYKRAIDELLVIQKIPGNEFPFIPNYDAQFLQFEMSLFRDWFIDRHLQLELTADEHQIIEKTFELLTYSAIEQPQAFVHRDYHSRNLMILEQDAKALGIIDFQDAVKGPISYDLVSLLKDCYIQWPQKDIEKWCRYYWQKATDAKLLIVSFEHFFKCFELMGMQRHIKVLGIFCRLNYRDDKPQYLNDLDLTFYYLEEAANRYPEFESFTNLLKERIKPALALRTQVAAQ